MMRLSLKLYLLATSLLLPVFILAACASGPSQPSGFVRYEVIETSSPQKPVWIHQVPDETGKHIFIGQSGYFASEQQARSDALRDAITKYAQYLGVEVSTFDDTLRQLESTESAIQDAQIKRQSRTTMQSNNLASRAKARTWYIEKLYQKQGESILGIAYQTWVEVTVPNSEVEKFQREKQQKRERADSRKQQVYQDAVNEIDTLVSRQQTVQTKAVNLTRNGDILSALSLLSTERKNLQKAQEKFRSSESRIATLAGRIDAPLTEVQTLTNQLQNSIVLDVGRFNNYCMKDDSGCEDISVWAWSRQGNQNYPLSNLPLVLIGETSRTKSSARTNDQGKATFQLNNASDAAYLVKVDENLIRIDPSLVSGLLAATNVVYIQRDVLSLNRLIDQGIQDLFQGPTPEPLPVSSLILGAVTFEDTPEGGEFALLVKDLLGQGLTRIDGLRVITPRKHNASELTRTMKTRGITTQTKGVGDGAMQAQLNRAESALQANYRMLGRDVQLSLALVRAETGELLRKTAFAVPSRLIPPGVALTAPDVSKTTYTPQQVRSDIKLDITSHLGNGQTYQEGDTISYFVSTNRDAYLLLIYQDAGGNLIQILPNRYSGDEMFRAGNYIEVPRRNDNYEFVIEGPFGVEHVWGFASTRPLPRLNGQDIGNGLVLLNGQIDSILSTLRRSGGQPGGSYGEARATITTVARR